MLDWFSERILSGLHAVPPIFGADAPHFAAARAFAALLLIALVVYVIAMRPFAPLISYLRALIDRRGSRKSRSK
jgi:hypothetical protein